MSTQRFTPELKAEAIGKNARQCRGRVFFNSLKEVRIRIRIYKTRDMTRAKAFCDIEVHYDRTRHLSPLGGVNPEAFERA